MSLRKVIALALPVLCLAVSAYAASPAEAAGSVVVAPGHMSGWTVTTNATIGGPYSSASHNPASTASHAFVDGPATPPLGTGSLLLSVGPDANSRVSAIPPGLIGRPFSDVWELNYHTYVEENNSAGHPHPIGVKLAGTSEKLGTFFTAVFEPTNQTQRPVEKKWQTWHALEGKWWTSRAPSRMCSQAEPCSWTDFVDMIGGGTRIDVAYFENGDSGTAFVDSKVALDAVNVDGVLYNFERTAPPSTTPHATTEQSAVGPGGVLTIHASGFLPHEEIRAELHSRVVILGHATANAAGDATLHIRLPHGTSPGSHVILVIGLSSGRQVTVEIVVLDDGGFLVVSSTLGPQTGFGGMGHQVSRHHLRA